MKERETVSMGSTDNRSLHNRQREKWTSREYCQDVDVIKGVAFKFSVEDNRHRHWQWVDDMLRLELSFAWCHTHDEVAHAFAPREEIDRDQYLEKPEMRWGAVDRKHWPMAIWTDSAIFCMDSDQICRLWALRTPGKRRSALRILL